MALKAFTSTKDVSESMAAIQAANKHGLWRLHNMKNSSSRRRDIVLCLCIGDGSTSRTAVLACFLKKWDCISIDPALHQEWNGDSPKGVRGLVGYGGTLEEFMMQEEVVGQDGGGERRCKRRYDHLLLLCVHSHARLIGNASVPNIQLRYGHDIPTTLISLPCCPKYKSQQDVG